MKSRSSSIRWPFSKRASTLLAFGLAVGGPVVAFVLGTWALSSTVIIVLGAALFLGLFRIVFRLTKFLRYTSERDRAADIALTLLFALVLPFGGLALNLHIPFPADFANLWPWAFSALTALFLALRADSGRPGLVLWFLRFTVAPFLLYFFLLFLPFLPLAVLAVVIFGAGFLILAPARRFRSSRRGGPCGSTAECISPTSCARS